MESEQRVHDNNRLPLPTFDHRVPPVPDEVQETGRVPDSQVLKFPRKDHQGSQKKLEGAKKAFAGHGRLNLLHIAVGRAAVYIPHTLKIGQQNDNTGKLDNVLRAVIGHTNWHFRRNYDVLQYYE